MKTKVRVSLVLRAEVDLEVEHEPDDDQCDLTQSDKRRAKNEAELLCFCDVEIERVEEI